MFEDALVESSNRLSTQNRYISLPAILLNILVLLALVLWPLLHPLALPRQAFTTLLIAPAPPPAPAPLAAAPAHSSPAHVPAALAQLTAPSRIPRQITNVADANPPSNSGIVGIGIPGGAPNAVPGGLFEGQGTLPRQAVLAAPTKKVAISSGVMAGNKLSGADPVYPAIARQAHISGTVTLAATISKTGTIENLRVLSGPPLLTAASIDAVRSWCYQPYLLNGQPVEVETTINIVFNLGS